MQKFVESHPDAETHRLRVNHPSTKVIISATDSLINHSYPCGTERFANNIEPRPGAEEGLGVVVNGFAYSDLEAE